MIAVNFNYILGFDKAREAACVGVTKKRTSVDNKITSVDSFSYPRIGYRAIIYTDKSWVCLVQDSFAEIGRE